MSNLSGGTGSGLPVYYTGRRLTNATILPLSQNTDGSFAKGSSLDLCSTLTVEYVRFLSDTTKEEISPANNTVENEVILKNRFTVEIGEIKLADISVNAAINAYGSADYFLVTAVTSPDGGTTRNYVQAIVSRSSFSDEYAVGKSTNGFVGSCAGQDIAVSQGSPTWS